METTQDASALTPAIVAEAVERIVAACAPRAVLAFGSRARGQARTDSDLDLCVLLAVPVPDRTALRRRLRALLADLPFSKDILVSDPQTFASARAQLNNVYQEIDAESVALWHAGRLDPNAVERVCS